MIGVGRETPLSLPFPRRRQFVNVRLSLRHLILKFTGGGGGGGGEDNVMKSIDGRLPLWHLILKFRE